jgi:Cu/Ag efflux pump CusA
MSGRVGSSDQCKAEDEEQEIRDAVRSLEELWDYRTLVKRSNMTDKMPERMKAVLINACIVAALIWCYFRGYPLTAILIAGLLLLGVANIAMYLKRR